MTKRPRRLQSATCCRLCRLSLCAALLAFAPYHPVSAQSADAPRVAAAAPPTAAADDSRQRQILLLGVDDMSRRWVQLIVDGFREVALSQERPPALYFESIDTSRFTDAAYVDGLRDWLRQKYRDRSLDLIVPLAEDAVGFLATQKGEPWPDTPILFIEVGGVGYDLDRDLPNAAGLILEDHFPAALRVVKQILPETERVALIYGASAVEQNRFGGFADRVRSSGLGL